MTLAELGRYGPLCPECHSRRADTNEDEICPECFQSHIDAAHFTRLFKIACGWPSDSTGAIHKPKNPSLPQQPRILPSPLSCQP